MHTIDISHTQEIYTVSRLNRDARLLLEENFFTLWVEGEISNFAAPHSGHWYFSLKDVTAQVRCAMFKPQNYRLNFMPQNGMQVLAKARVSLYEGRGEFQLLIEHLEEAGIGQLQKEFELLKKRLLQAGLFDAAHKKTLPAFPKTIGIITSATGAAIRDILHVLKRRFSAASIIIYPTPVQGELAATQIVNAIQTANQRREVDILILARGGGSLEDLWSFNEEKVAHAIYASELPIITGVGHEIDFTIADFVADVRAPTPSAAAELVTPDTNELLLSITQTQKHLSRLLTQRFQQFQQQLDWCAAQLQQRHPHHRIQTLQQQLLFQLQRLQNKITNSMLLRQQSLTNAAAKLDALSPLATLKRGFSIATLKDKSIVHSVKQVTKGDEINLQVMDGNIACTVT
jgi:exodeoxyribonuclease VII large subunit